MNELNKKAYEQLIEEDISVLERHLPDSLEKGHIISVLKDSIDRLYPNANGKNEKGETNE